MVVKSSGFGVAHTYIQILPLPLISCATLSKLPTLSKPHFTYLQIGNNMHPPSLLGSTSSLLRIENVSEIIRSFHQCLGHASSLVDRRTSF